MRNKSNGLLATLAMGLEPASPAMAVFAIRSVRPVYLDDSAIPLQVSKI